MTEEDAEAVARAIARELNLEYEFSPRKATGSGMSRVRATKKKKRCSYSNDFTLPLGGSETSVSEFPGRAVGTPIEPPPTLPEGSYLAFDPPPPEG